MKSKIVFLILTLLFLMGFVYRLKGLERNYSFWIDETSSATFARAILETGRPVLPSGYAANDYSVHFYLMALSFRLFGLNEFAGRLPSVVFGALTILAVFYLGKRFADARVGMLAALLVTFSTLEIVYSRQARSYQELQFFALMTVIAFIAFVDAHDQRHLRLGHVLFLIVSFLLVTLTHKFGLLLLFVMLIYLLFVRNDISRHYFRRFWEFIRHGGNLPFKVLLLALPVIVAFALFRYLNFYKALQETTVDFWLGKFGFTTKQYFEICLSHIKYYHSYFWRQYPHISLFALMGLSLAFLRKEKMASLFVIIISVYLGFIVFRVFAHFVRYVFLIFPFFLILSSYFLVWFTDSVFSGKKKHYSLVLLVLLSLFIVFNGNKFSLVPKSYYSLNSEMVEIPEPDFKSVYAIIQERTGFGKAEVMVIDNRTDSSQWYLGEGKPDYYLVGPLELEPSWNIKKGVKKDPVSGATYLNSLEDFERIVNGNERGFVVLEERAADYMGIEAQMIDFVKGNLKREVRLEHIRGNDLSIWPMELYSWGFN